MSRTAVSAPGEHLAAALAYAAYGWRVFPAHSIFRGECTCRKPECSSPGKHPRIDGGCNAATTDGATIREWWVRWPTANVCIATGKRLMVLDIDPAHGGDDALAELTSLHGALPATVEATTGRGGRHLYFEFEPDEYDVRNSAGQIGHGIDVRATGGYVVAPPSVTTGAYAWDAGYHPDDTPVAPAPGWLLRLATRTRHKNGGPSVNPETGQVDMLLHGGRNNALTSLAGFMRRKGLGEPAILAALLATNAERCVPPLDEAEVQRIAVSVARYEPADPVTGDSQFENWMLELQLDEKKRIKKTFVNCCIILKNLDGYRVAYDSMRCLPTINGGVPSEHVIGKIRIKIGRELNLEFSMPMVCEALAAVAEEKESNPVRDYLQPLVWDREPRIHRVASEILGCPSPTALTQAMIRCWFISAVARIAYSGCKVDSVFVLIGRQGLGKSSFFRILGGDWFRESSVKIEDKDAVLQLYSAWIYEWPEIDHLTLSRDASVVKRFLSQQTDNIRNPYARAVAERRRHTVIVGTTNKVNFLDDSTGNRRYWPVSVGRRINTERLHEWRDQLWAEAVEALREGEQWHLTPEFEKQLSARNARNELEDPWDTKITRWLTGQPRPVTITGAEIMARVLDMRATDMTKGAQLRLAGRLRKLGAVSVRVGVSKIRTWRFSEVPT